MPNFEAGSVIHGEVDSHIEQIRFINDEVGAVL